MYKAIIKFEKNGKAHETRIESASLSNVINTVRDWFYKHSKDEYSNISHCYYFNNTALNI